MTQSPDMEQVVRHDLDQPNTAGAPADPSATVAPASFADLGAGRGPGAAADLRMLSDVPLDVTVELGRAVMKLRDLLTLAEGSVIELNRALGAPVDIIVNGKLVARGDVVVVGDDFGVRVTEVLSPGER
jgi:flagellar motor switch protein FliN